MKVKLLIFILFLNGSLYSQDIGERTFNKYFYWTLLQAFPCPTYYHDGNGIDNRMQFGFKWNVIPLNVSFRTNKYISNFQFFMINPVRRFTGSAEIFLQPEVTTANFKYSNLKNWGISSGTRIILPITERGEDVCISLAAKYSYRKDNSDNNVFYTGIEGGIYFFGGMIGLQYTHNISSRTNFNFNFYLKYF